LALREPLVDANKPFIDLFLQPKSKPSFQGKPVSPEDPPSVSENENQLKFLEPAKGLQLPFTES
jgi:hypothetical protein